MGYQLLGREKFVSDEGYSLDDMNKHCLAEFRKHWECLDDHNQQLWQCRKFERPLNKCVFDNLVCCKSPLQRSRLEWLCFDML